MTVSLDSPVREPILVIADIIQTELELDEGAVMIYNQRYPLPTTKGLFIALSIVSSKVIGNNNYPTPSEAGMAEKQELALNTLIQIDIMSANEEARQRKDEVLMALASVYSQQKQDQYGMRIARIPQTWLDASDIEGTAILNRYTTTMPLFSISRKIKTCEYYDDFEDAEIVVNV